MLFQKRQTDLSMPKHGRKEQIRTFLLLCWLRTRWLTVVKGEYGSSLKVFPHVKSLFKSYVVDIKKRQDFSKGRHSNFCYKQMSVRSVLACAKGNNNCAQLWLTLTYWDDGPIEPKSAQKIAVDKTLEPKNRKNCWTL